MNERASAPRHRAHRLLKNLVETTSGADVGDPAEAEAALRHLSLAGLNLATEADAPSLLRASRALGWMAVALAWEEEEADLEGLVALIQQGHLAPHLGAQTLARRLGPALDAPTSQVRRAPTGAGDARGGADRRAQILGELADHDQRVADAATLAPHRRRDALFSDSQLLATVLELSEERALPAPAQVLVDLLPRGGHLTGEALHVLSRFERAQFDAIPAQMGQLGERPRRFEQSMGRHLQRHGLLPAVRAALTLGADQGPDRRGDRPVGDDAPWRLYLNQCPLFAEDPPLVELALALIAMRRRTVAHLAGALPLAGLSPWVDYLRGPCADFAESRGITLREATNFAHYSLHLLNICDLAARRDRPLTDRVRRAVMDVEDELKEFALVGQRRGLSDRQSDLGRYESNQWRRDGLHTLLASRLARLCGAWRAGHRPGPLGSPPRPDHELFDHCLALVGDGDAADRDALAQLFQRAHLQGLPEFEGWRPQDVLAILRPALFAAQQADTIDVDAPFCLDFGGLTRWLGDADRHRRATVLTTLASHHRGPGSGAALLQRQQGLSARAEAQRLRLTFCPDPELEAIVTLLANQGDQAPLAAPLRQRLMSLLAPPSPPPPVSPPSPAPTCSPEERP